MVTDDSRTRHFTLPDNQRRILEALVRRTHCPQAIAVRAKIVLAADDGLGMTQIGRNLGCSRELARRWRDRFAEGQARWGASADPWDFDALTDKVIELLQDCERSGGPFSKIPPIGFASSIRRDTRPG